jgi:hypothetical protein
MIRQPEQVSYTLIDTKTLQDIQQQGEEPREEVRKLPYYAILACQCFDYSISSIKINHCMEVLDKHDSPIRGLYATGNDAGWVDR